MDQGHRTGSLKRILEERGFQQKQYGKDELFKKNSVETIGSPCEKTKLIPASHHLQNTFQMDQRAMCKKKNK